MHAGSLRKMSATQKLVAQIAVLATGQVLMYWTVKWLIKQMDPNRDKKDAAKQLSSKVLRRLKQGKIQLTEHEDMVAADVIDPSDISTTWEDIGGMESTLKQLTESVVPCCFISLYIIHVHRYTCNCIIL